MTTIFVLDIHAEIYRDALAAEFPGLDVRTARNIAEMPKDLSGIDVLIAFGTSINNELLDRFTGLKWIQSLATGVDHFLRWPGLRKEIIITSGRGIHGASMRETVAYLMLGISRDAVGEVARKQKHHWERRLWSLLEGKTAVVAGSGVAGSAIGKLCQAFGMHTIGLTRTPRQIEGFDEVMHTDKLAEAAGRADYLIDVLPATGDNANLFDKSVFGAMKKSAYFINVGRGDTVDEPALIEALRNGTIAGAGLDVFSQRPLPADSLIWDMPNVFMTPHIAGYFIEYEDHALPIILGNMRLYLAGRAGEMRNLVGH
jgi:phosphoglycerate dehydrogenase-like enzyme